ncbi:MAG TPA: hypothetical protein VIK89_16280 [Cytophagaceae bacterium]
MKKLLVFLFVGGMISFSACQEGQNEMTQTEVLERDTTGVEYQVEETAKETTVDVDTTTQTETKEVEEGNQQNQQNQ